MPHRNAAAGADQMPRQRKELAALHKVADPIEARLARAFERAAEKLKASISINELAMKLAIRDAKGAMRLLTKDMIKEALGPSATIVRDATIRGGKLGAEAVRDLR